MDSFTRYISRQLLIGMIFVGTGLTAIIWLSQSLRFVELIVNRGVSPTTFAYLTLLLLPNFLTIILPISTFFVVLFVYAKMISDREIVVMRSAGLSQIALAKPALIIAFSVVAIGYLLNLYLLPESYRIFRELQWDLRNNYSHVLLKEGTFNSVSSRFTVYIRQHSSNGELLGVLVHDNSDQSTYMAKRGALVEASDAVRVVLFKGSRQGVDPKTNKLSILYFDRYILDMDWSRQSKEQRYREPRERSFFELWYLDPHLDISFKDHGKYVTELHKRLTAPLFGIGFTLLALACLTSGHFNHLKQTHRILSAVFCMTVIQLAQLGLENFVSKKIDFIPVLYINAVLPIFLGSYLILHYPRKRRKLSKMASKQYEESKI